MPEQALISDPLSLFIFLLGVVALIFYVSELPGFRRVFKYLPPLAFCYFVPMLCTTAGITPMKNPLYDALGKYLLPPLLILLLLPADIKAIIRLGPKAVTIMLAGSAGILFGAVVGYALFGGKLPPEAWKSVGALAASWTGGSANMIAVKGALEIPDAVFSPILIVDPLMAYSWLGVVIALAGWQEGFGRRFRVNNRVMEELNERVQCFRQEESRAISTRELLILLGVAGVGGYLCILGGAELATRFIKPAVARIPILEVLSAGTLTVVFASVLGLALSGTPLRRLECVGASSIGYALLFILLPTFGAQANLSQIDEIPWYAAIGALMLGMLALMLLLTMWLWRAPLFLGAVGSQANVGGPASAAVAASAYQPALVPVGVLLGVLGGVLGTFIGLLTAHLCKLLAPG